jgi:hypothetical protein
MLPTPQIVRRWLMVEISTGPNKQPNEGGTYESHGYRHPENPHT